MVKLKRLLTVLPEAHVQGETDIAIQHIAYDSRSVGRGDLFVALKGKKHDGHEFIRDAVQRGATCVMMEDDIETDRGVTIHVPDSRRALALLAALYYDNPAEKLTLIGITGTNGKTTISRLVKSILEEAGHKVGLIGTIDYWIGNERIPAGLTTPESLDLHRMFKKMIEESVSHAVLEVSSHSLRLDRVFGLEFDVGVFSNLSRDHLDFHGSFEEYEQAKRVLFRSLNWSQSRAVINRDDPSGRRMMEVSRAPVISYGFDTDSAIWANGLSFTSGMSHFTIHVPEDSIPIDFKLLGRFNVYNALAAFGVGYALGIRPSVIKGGLERVDAVEGRFERIECGQPFTVIVDYSHTPDALEQCLQAAKEITRKRVIVTFGCGGNRDKGKRPLMGEVAGRLADYIIITSDNPRDEDPESILDDIENGLRPESQFERIADRRRAIQRAIEFAEEGDCVVIAGKGHEDYQIIGPKRVSFNDKAEVEHILKREGKEQYAFHHGEIDIR